MSSGNEPRERPSDEELSRMSRDELVELGGRLDGVELVNYPDPWPVEGTRAEKRAERSVALWFAVSAVFGLAFLAALIFWPSEYAPPSEESAHFWYSWYTPMLGITLGISVLALSVAVLLYTKRFVPDELAVQERSDNMGAGSDELDRQTILAQLTDSGERSTIARRSMIKRTAGAGAGVLGLGTVALPLAGFIEDPWANPESKDSLAHTAWKKQFPGEKVYLRRSTGNPHDVSLVRPEDLDAGGMETVWPFRESERNDDHALAVALKRADSPVMLIRLRTEDAEQVVQRAGQEGFNYGTYYAYSKVCTHVGCPASLYEQQTNRLLCPCHQSQFNMLEYAKPVFGPATRALPQLPITVDEEGYFIARHDFIEPVGPAYWERAS